MTNKEKYIAISNQVPLFYKPWYLDLVCDSSWDVLLLEEEESIAAFWVFMPKEKLKLKYLISPEFCPYFGFYSLSGDVAKQWKHLYSQLPKHQFLDVKLWPGLSVSTPTPQIKHTRKLHTNTPVHIDYLASPHRNKIRKGQKTTSLIPNVDFETASQFIRNSFEEQNRPCPFNLTLLQKLWSELKGRGSLHTMMAVDKEDGKPLAIAMFFLDQHAVYNIINASSRRKNHYAMHFLLWEGIQFAQKKGLAFDFEGSQIEGVDHLYRQFCENKTDVQQVIWYANPIIRKAVAAWKKIQ